MDIAHVIQSSIAPVFLFTGVAATLGVLTNRLARIVDRARVLEDRLEERLGDRLGDRPGDRPGDRLERRPGGVQHLNADLAVLARRARHINFAISLCALAALLVALMIVTLFANAFLGSELGVAIALLFVAAMVCLSAAYITFFIEVRQATAALRIGPHGN